MATKEPHKTLEQMMIEAGIVVLEQDQLQLVADSISYAKVFSYLEKKYSVRVTRASVHKRIWESDAHFRQDVLNEAIHYFPTVLPGAQVVEVFKAALRAAHSEPTVEQRIDTFVRILFGATGEIVSISPARRHLQSAKAVSSRFNDPQATPAFPALLNDHLESVAVRLVQIFGGLKSRLGIQADTSIGLDAETIAYLVETLRNAIDSGAFLNNHAGSTASVRPVRFRGVDQDVDYPWFPASIGQSFLVRYFHIPCEVDSAKHPDFGAGYIPDPETTGLAEHHMPDPDARRQRDKLRQLILAGGVDLLLNTASELKPTSLTYANVFRHIKETSGTVVYRASVHKRIWETQQDYVLDVLNHSLTQSGDNPLAGHGAEPSTITDSTTETVCRLQTAQDRIRILAKTKASLFSESIVYRRLLLTKAALFGKQDQPTVKSVRETIEQIDDEFIATCKNLTTSRLLTLGFEVRPELGISQEEALDIYGVLLLTVITGLNFDHIAGVKSSFQAHKLPRVDGTSDTEEWTLEGIAGWVFFDQLFVEDSQVQRR